MPSFRARVSANPESGDELSDELNNADIPGTLVPAALDARGNGIAVRAQDAAVPAAGIRQGISRAQSARHYSVSHRRRDRNDGVLRHLSLSRHQIRPDAADRR